MECADAPRPLLGRDGDEPGFWANTANEAPWTRGSRNSLTSGTTLHELRQARLYREPGLRISRAHFDGPRFFKTIGNKIANVEALLAQATGSEVVATEECNHCQLGHGPFVSCVVVPGIFRECANCHWSQQEHRCSFLTHQPAALVPRRQSLESELRELQDARDEALAHIRRLDARIEEIRRAQADAHPHRSSTR